ncbi:MAG: hypothetical protein ACLFWM_14240, partial [Actinomycetota bacterium]
MGSDKRYRGRIVALIGAVLVVGMVSTALAAPEKKTFAAEVAVSAEVPPTIPAGVPATFDVTIYNTSSSVPLGAAEVSVPSPSDAEFLLDPASVVVNDPNWSFQILDGSVRVMSNDSQSRLAPCTAGDHTACPSVTVSMDLTVLQPFADGIDYSFGVEARQANNFNGTLNDLNLEADRSSLGVTVTGLGERCESNPCRVDLPQEVDTSLQLTASCVGECTGVVGADIDASYCDDPGTCVGQGVFWNPPADADGDVTVELVIDKGSYKGNPNALQF